MAESQDIELILPDEEVDPRAADVIQESAGDLDTSATNVIQVVCIDDTDAAALVHYTINTFATDTTP